MKKSIALAIAIVVLGSIPGLLQQNRIQQLREDHRKLSARAAALGLPPDSSGTEADLRLTKRQREDKEKHATTTAADIVAFAKELEAMEKSGVKNDSAFQSRAMEMMARLVELDASQLKRVIAELRADTGLSAKTRGNLISFAILSLSNEHPESAVALYTESSDLMDKSMMGEHAITSALTRWGELDSSAALEWIRKNAQSHPEIANDEAKRSVISGTAVNDPKLAFKLIGELKLTDPMAAVSSIMITGNESPDRRSAVLEALREHLGTIQDAEQREELGGKALELFARTSDKQGFEDLTGWMEDAEFTPKEKEQFADGLTYFTTKQDTGRWVEWLASNLPAATLPNPVRELVGEWTQQDYQSAGKWLAGYPDGPAKTSAVEAYAEAVAEYEPQVAAQWAMTLPPGPGRDATLKSIYQNWPASDPEGASAFARDHGLE